MQTLKTSKAKESILNKIRMALQHQATPQPYAAAEKSKVKDVFASEGMSIEETFASAFIAAGGKFIYCDSEQEFLDSVHLLYDDMGWNKILCADKRMTNLCHNNRLNMVLPADSLHEDADACITGCDALVARTGSVMVSSRLYKGRTTPVFYPVHIVFAYPEQLVRDIEDGITLIKTKYSDDLPSMINLNTGPSRTTDIEKTLVTGVHGPKEVFCFYINA